MSNNVIQREAGGRFAKGVSANPGGRPPMPQTVRELAATYSIEAIETLRCIMADKDQPGPSRVAAASAILDRAYGRPPQAISADVTTRFAFELPLVELTEDEWCEANTLAATAQ